jgi:hypothetical protein
MNTAYPVGHEPPEKRMGRPGWWEVEVENFLPKPVSSENEQK